MSKPKVYLTGGDSMNWALDDDLRLTKKALANLVEFTDLQACEVVHSMTGVTLAEIPEKLLMGKRIICHVPGEPLRYMTIPGYSRTLERVGQWVAHSQQAARQLSQLRITCKLIPYTIDPQIFHTLAADDPGLLAIREKWQIPADAYLIGNFHRDTEGYDLRSPKLVKGPDIFVEILKPLFRQGVRFHVVLAGPRRFWLRQRFAETNIPYTFVGEETPPGKDDIDVNVLPQSTLNVLYNLIDIYLVSSRSEGGPRSILEASAAKCKLLSSDVGIAPDILMPQAIYKIVPEAVNALHSDIERDSLGGTLDVHYGRVLQKHIPEAVTPLFQEIYQELESIPVFNKTKRLARPSRPYKNYDQVVKQSMQSLRHNKLGRFWRKNLKPVFGSGSQYLMALQKKLASQPNELTVSLWHKFVKPPYGGGNQFMLALRKALQAQGIAVVENQLHEQINAYVLNAIHFDIDSFLRFQAKHPQLGIVHRIDGPIQLIRGYDEDKDDLTYNLNAKLAAATVIQSNWTYQQIVQLGYQPVNPVIIHNGVDKDIFHATNRIPFSTQRKIRLISSSWSDNPRKGGPIYKWLDQHLDWSRFEYTFVGRVSEAFDNIRQIPPVPSEKLADILRQHDIYITASRNDPCSNALLEAMACGLPALYLNSGGHPELVGFGGLPFEHEEEILVQLNTLVDNYDMFQKLIVVASINEVAEKYLTLLKDVAIG